MENNNIDIPNIKVVTKDFLVKKKKLNTSFTKKNNGFTEAQKKKIKNRQHNICNNYPDSTFHKKYKFECPLHSHPKRKGHWDIEGCEIDNIKPKHLGGKNNIKNGQALCLSCHAVKTKEERAA